MSESTAPSAAKAWFAKPPWRITGVGDFWRTWNPGAHDFLKCSVYRKIRPVIGSRFLSIMAVFIFNGILHDLVIVGFDLLVGMPLRPIFTQFFIMQGLVVGIERCLGLELRWVPVPLKTVITLVWICATFSFAIHLSHSHVFR